MYDPENVREEGHFLVKVYHYIGGKYVAIAAC